jgi:type III restriction enzyme
MLNSGKVLMLETKGSHLDNDESKEKAKIGDQ